MVRLIRSVGFGAQSSGVTTSRLTESAKPRNRAAVGDGPIGAKEIWVEGLDAFIPIMLVSIATYVRWP